MRPEEGTNGAIRQRIALVAFLRAIGLLLLSRCHSHEGRASVFLRPSAGARHSRLDSRFVLSGMANAIQCDQGAYSRRRGRWGFFLQDLI